MALPNSQQVTANLAKSYNPSLTMVVVASGTTAMLTYYTGQNHMNFLTDTSGKTQIPNKAVGDILFSTTSTTDTISVTGSTDGVNYDSQLNKTAGAELVIFDMSTGLPHPSGDLATGNYRIPYRYHQQWQSLKFLKSGTNAVASLAVAKIERV
jgi:hypothetical protein